MTRKTVALIAGGHTFGKTARRGARIACGVNPEAGDLEAQGFGWKSSYGTGWAGDAINQRPRSDLDHDTYEVEQRLLQAPVRLRMGADEESAGAASVAARTAPAPTQCPVHTIRRSGSPPPCWTTDLSLRLDPAYEKISRRLPRAPGSSLPMPLRARGSS